MLKEEERCDRMGKIQIDTERCKGCGLCVTACPKKLIKIGDNMNSLGYHTSQIDDEEKQCVGCANCAEMCPDIAIEVWR